MATPADRVLNSTPLKVQVVICDLDGTLIHTGPDLAEAVNRMLNELDRETYPEAHVLQWIGNGVPRLVKRALTNSKEGEPEPSEFEPALEIFRKHYRQVVSDRSQPFPGVVEALGRMRERGFRLACVTNKAHAFTEPLLRDLAMEQYFEVTLSGDSLSKKKPDPLPLLHICEHFGVAPSQAVLIGDSLNDVQAADAAGMPVICVSYGYNQGADLTKTNAAAIIDSFGQLDALLEYIN